MIATTAYANRLQSSSIKAIKILKGLLDQVHEVTPMNAME